MTSILPWTEIRAGTGDLGRLAPFDQGGEGVLYRLPDCSGSLPVPLLYKQYRPDILPRLDAAALERFPRFARTLRPNMFRWLYRRASWPTWVVEDPARATVTGVAIPQAPARFMATLRRPSGGTRLVPAKVELLLNGDDFLRSVGLAVSPRQKLQIAAAAAESMAFLHSNSIAIGDFSCKNMLFATGPEPGCFLIDCDSMSWSGRFALAGGETPEWELPDGEQPGTASADAYKFALLVLRLHTGAQHHRNPARLPATVPPALRLLVERSIAADPGGRPLITEWLQPLKAAAAEASPLAPDPRPPAAVHHFARHPSPGRQVPPTPGPAAAPPGAHRHRPVAQPWAGGLTLVLLRRLLVRRPVNPSFTRIVAMLLGLWAACAAVFGFSILCGIDVRHMGRRTEIVLFGTYLGLALTAFALATTEPY